jgi:hypothetical protein
MKRVIALATLLVWSACHQPGPLIPRPIPTSADSAKILKQFADHIQVGLTTDRDILRLASLDDQHYFAVVSISTGTCAYSYLILLNNQFDILKGICVEDNPDSDESFARYEYKDYETVRDSIFLLHDIVTHVVDTTLVDAKGMVKGDKTIDDVDTKTDTTTQQISLSMLLTNKIPDWPKLW